MHLRQNINNPIAQISSAFNTVGGLVATPFTGAVNDSVLLFAAAPLILGPGGYLAANNDANNGTTVTINKPGAYTCVLSVECDEEPIDVVVGLSQDVAAAGLTNAPAFATAGFLDVQRTTYAGAPTAGMRVPLQIATTVIVSPEQAVAGSVIRFHATTPAGAAPANAFVAASAFYVVQRVNQAHS